MRSFLIVDDSKIQIELQEALLRHKYPNAFVTSALNGMEALEMINRMEYTVILSDIAMPVMDGIEFHKRLKGETPFMARRVAFISSAIDDPATTSYLLDEWLPGLAKPFDNREYLDFVETILSSEARDLPSEQGNAYLRRHTRLKADEKCMLEPVDAPIAASNGVIAKISDYSEEGLGVKCSGTKLPIGLRVKVFIDTFNVAMKGAEVVWSEFVGGNNRAGLQWI